MPALGPAQSAAVSVLKGWEGETVESEEEVKMSVNLYLRVIQKTLSLSLMITAMALRKIVQRILGFQIGQIQAGRNMNGQGQHGWVSVHFKF